MIKQRVKEERRVSMKKRFISVIALALLLAFVGMGLAACGSGEDDSSKLQEAAQKAVVTEVQQTTMKTESEGEAVVLFTVPDYVQLFSEACKQDKFDRYLLKSLQKGQYETVQVEQTVPFMMEDNEMVLQTDEALEQILEPMLIDAVNAVTKEEAAQ